MPLNYIILASVTVLEAITVSALTAGFSAASVLLAVGVLAITLVFLFVTALMIPNKSQILKYMVVGLIIACVLQLVFLILLFFSGSFPNVYYILYGVLGVIISGVYIIFDLTVLMAAGAIDYDDYILGSLMLYFDIMRMFVYLVMLLGKQR